MLKKISFLIFLFLISAPNISAKESPEHWADLLMKAHDQKALMPLISEQASNLDMNTAYLIQKAFVKKRMQKDLIVGFKAGLTSAAAQKKFGADRPLFAVLFSSGWKGQGGKIESSHFKKLMIETEIGFVLGEAIKSPVETVAALQKKMHSIAPVIELPDLGFKKQKGLKAVDLVAANVGSAQFLMGATLGADQIDPNEIRVVLYLDGKKVNQGEGRDILAGQWETALWMVNQALQQGWELKPGYVFITGALGKILPGKPGHYLANFGPLDRFSFEVK